jgi:hypothetical protein
MLKSLTTSGCLNPATFFASLGDTLDQSDEVIVYGAVMGKDQELINAGSWVQFQTPGEEVYR